MNSEELSTLHRQKLATIYRRFAENDINIMQMRLVKVSDTHMWYTLVAEYSLEKKAYATNGVKIIWPKIAVDGVTLLSALEELEKVVEEIRRAGAREN